MTHAPAGWYELPSGLNQHWNGSHWVSTVSNAVETQPKAAPIGPVTPPRPTRSGAVSALLLVGLTALVSLGGRRRGPDGRGRAGH